jgi:hypothetical protein
MFTVATQSALPVWPQATHAVGLLQAQRFVEDEAACACKAAHLPALLPGGHQLEPKSLLDKRSVILYGLSI